MKNTLSLVTLLVWHSHAIAQKNIPFTATYEKDKKAVLIQWQHFYKNAESYTLQSSRDNTFFTDIFTKQNTNIYFKTTISYYDKTITGEKIYYLLKIKLNDSLFETSLPISVTLNVTENTWLIYPLPAKDFIHLKYIGNGTIDGVISIYIQRINSGVIYSRLRLASNTKNIIIPITNLGSGIYNIHVSISNRVGWNQQFNKY